MEFEDSRNALFVEPNAYIQHFNKEKSTPKKIVFQEPYECLPNYYLDNNFNKHSCDCVHGGCKPNNKHDCVNSNNPQNNHDCNSNHEKPNNFLDFKNLAPLLGMFSKGNSGIMDIVSNLGKGGGSGFNLQNILGLLGNNKNMLGNIMDLFSKNKTSKEKSIDIPTTDYEIKNYTRVN